MSLDTKVYSEDFVIEAKKICKGYKRRIQEEEVISYLKGLILRNYETIESIKNVSLNIKQGEIIGLIGPNGSGKTTLIKMLTGLIKPSSGNLLVFGKDPNKREETFLQNISVVLAQKNQLWWDLSPRESFKLNQKIYQIEDNKYSQVLERLVNLLDVKHVMNSPVRNLSLGERMKCEIIACLLHEPKIIFLDEPTIGLDILAQKRIREFIRNYCKENKITVILTSHILEDIVSVCERLIVLKNGEIIYDGDKDKLLLGETELVQLEVKIDGFIDINQIKIYGEIIECKESNLIMKVQKRNYFEVLQYLNNLNLLADYEIKNVSIDDVVEQIFG